MSADESAYLAVNKSHMYTATNAQPNPFFPKSR